MAKGGGGYLIGGTGGRSGRATSAERRTRRIPGAEFMSARELRAATSGAPVARSARQVRERAARGFQFAQGRTTARADQRFEFMRRAA